MTKIILTAFFLLCGFFAADLRANYSDSVQVWKQKLETVEKQLQQLQSELKSLRTTDSILVAEVKDIRKSTPASKPKKLVIDRRGSKQAYWQ